MRFKANKITHHQWLIILSLGIIVIFFPKLAHWEENLSFLELVVEGCYNLLKISVTAFYAALLIKCFLKEE